MIQREALRSTVRIVTPPAALPVRVEDVLDELGLTQDSAGRVSRLIETATNLAEAFTNRAFITRTLQMQLDEFPTGRIPWWDGVREGTIRALSGEGIITLPKPPLIQVQSVQYYDLSNTLQTVNASTYIVDTLSEPARISLNFGELWPSDTRDRAAVIVNYSAGYGSTSASVPAIVKDAIISHVRDVIERPNSSVASESIDNASVSYNALHTGDGADRTGGLRGDAPALLASLRILDSGV